MSQERLPREPRVAYCEDEYEEEEVTTPLANVAIKRADAASVTKRTSYERRRNDGSDSGYSSKTGTNTSTSSIRRDMADLKLDTAAIERQPQPYAYIQRPEAHRRSSSRSREEAIEPPAPRLRYFVHKKGECYVCDKYGEHLPEKVRPREAATPSSPTAKKKVQPSVARPEEPGPRPHRRDSAVHTSRPVSMYASGMQQFNYQPTQAMNMMSYAAPNMSSAGWPTPLTPSTPWSPTMPYTPAVMTTTYVTDASYFEQPLLQENRPPRSDRRSSTYGEAIIRQSKVEPREKEPQKTTSTRNNGRSNSERTVRADDYDRMPPPPPPSRPTEVTLAHRPSIKKSATYNTPLTANTNRRSQVIEDDVIYVNSATAPTSSRDRRPELSRPPSSYRGPAEVPDVRPSTRKSASYSTPTQTTKVSSSMAPPVSTHLPRRSTTTSTPTETRKVFDAEAYQAQRSSLTSNDLTAEALRNLKQRHPSSQSETSSRRSHHTKSSSSAGGKSKRSNSEIKMNINGLNLSIPASVAEQNISISTRKDGDISISLGGRGDRDDDGSRASSQKRIEQASSATSRASHISSKSINLKERERERMRERDRDLEQYDRARRQSHASRSRSRTDAVRRSYDHERNSPNPWKE